MTAARTLSNLLLRLPSAIAMRLRILWLRLLGMKIGARCWMQRVHVRRNPWEIEIEGRVALDCDVTLLVTGKPREEPKIVIRSGTYINRLTMLDAAERVEIGPDCMIGPMCYITDHDHGHERGRLLGEQAQVIAPVSVGRDVWLGAGVCILKGVTIGDGAIIGAGAVVTRDVASHEIIAGVPGRVIGQRS